MTITKYDGLAILPKRCDKCNRLFWLEPYNIFYETVGIEEYPLKQIACKNCIGKTDVLDKLRAELHETAEMHEDGDYYLRDEWIDEYFDKYKSEKGDQNDSSSM